MWLLRMLGGGRNAAVLSLLPEAGARPVEEHYLARATATLCPPGKDASKLELRFVDERYKPKGGGNSIDGSHLGVGFNAYF